MWFSEMMVAKQYHNALAVLVVDSNKRRLL